MYRGGILRPGYICALWLEPNHRGSNGATMLVDEANRWLFTRGVESVNAWVANSNARAAAFYRKFGFTPTARTQRLPSNPLELETLWVISRPTGKFYS
ncbi:GNAT family N-acetyltransferase [Herbaspirillum rubrisubalbicans]|uniref:GNAT family N-acetyltransferase n=1 Tax=Herbaspirillum rubrisubalbicans TaxID=80842 RepID=UPI0009E74583